MKTLQCQRNKVLEMIPKNGTCLEIGVLKGIFSKKILDITKPKILHGVDPWCTQNTATNQRYTHDDNLMFTKKLLEPYIINKKLVLHQTFSEVLLPTFPDNYFDWVYIDGNHSYESVSAELKILDKKVKKSGYILGHDFINPDLYPENRRHRFQVVQAVKDFVNKSDWELIAKTPDNPPGAKYCPTFVLKHGRNTNDPFIL